MSLTYVNQVASQRNFNKISFVGVSMCRNRDGGGNLQKDSPNKKPWTKPELKRIGTINRVAGQQTAGSQAAGNTKS